MFSHSLRWQLRRNEVIAEIAFKAAAFFGVYLVAFFIWSAAFLSYLETGVKMVNVEKLADLEELFEIDGSTARVRGQKANVVCFVGDHVYALNEAKDWFAKHEIGWTSVLRVARGPTDVFNNEGESSIILLSHGSAIILHLSSEMGVSLANLGCASADISHIDIGRASADRGLTLRLDHATLVKPVPGLPPATQCVVKLQRFVKAVDELLAIRDEEQESYRAAARKYLPERGCRPDEAVAVLKTSRVAGIVEEYSSYQVYFSNWVMMVQFDVKKGSGNIRIPSIYNAKTLPSS